MGGATEGFNVLFVESLIVFQSNFVTDRTLASFQTVYDDYLALEQALRVVEIDFSQEKI